MGSSVLICVCREIDNGMGILLDLLDGYCSLSQSFYPGGTLEIIFRSQGTPA
jgi:hypothetical protein